LKNALEQERKFSREITGWIKTNLGVNLEKVNDLVSSSIESESKKQELETKKREESLWIIFGKKYEQQMLEFTEENNRTSEDRKKQDKKQWESFSQSFQEQRIEYEQLREKSMQELEQKLETERREIEKNRKILEAQKKKAIEEAVRSLEEEKIKLIDALKVLKSEHDSLELERKKNKSIERRNSRNVGKC